MTNIIPNEETWIGVVIGSGSSFGVADFDAPTLAEVASCTDLTDFAVMINPTSTGNTVPVPKLSKLWEGSLAGTAAGQLSGQFYRDNESDTAWNLLPRGTQGCFIISRFGGTGANKSPADGDSCEVWPFEISARPGDSLQSNTAQTFTITAAVPLEPGEDAVVTS